jgi:signal transduction histidine kinase
MRGAAAAAGGGAAELAVKIVGGVAEKVRALREVEGLPPGAVDEALALVRREVEACLPPPEPPAPVELAALFGDVAAEARAAAGRAGRAVEVEVDLPAGPLVAEAPRRLLGEALLSLVRNGIEHTPDEGRVRLAARALAGEAKIVVSVRDTGVGITVENRPFVLGGFYHTQDTQRYSSRRPYECGAGGKGLDLLRLKVIAERYGWPLDLASERCRFIPTDADECPGRISACRHCVDGRETCFRSGFTEVTLVLPRRPAR